MSLVMMSMLNLASCSHPIYDGQAQKSKKTFSSFQDFRAKIGCFLQTTNFFLPNTCKCQEFLRTLPRYRTEKHRNHYAITTDSSPHLLLQDVLPEHPALDGMRLHEAEKRDTQPSKCDVLLATGTETQRS
jgi:hypothetical protein